MSPRRPIHPSQPGHFRRVQRAERHSGQPETPHDQAKNALDEARMVLPGIQALFGFQLIAIFNDGFDTKLSSSEQDLHLAAISLVAVAVVLIMAP